MRNKLGKIALAIAFGLALAFAISCSGDDMPCITCGDQQPGYAYCVYYSGDGYRCGYMDPRECEGIGGMVYPDNYNICNDLPGGRYEPPPSNMFEGFGVRSYDFGKIAIVGKIYGTIANLEFWPAGWFSYDNDFLITLPTQYLKLDSSVYIDLLNSSIPCGTQYITVKACADTACNIFTTQNGTFEKPQSYCVGTSIL